MVSPLYFVENNLVTGQWINVFLAEVNTEQCRICIGNQVVD